MPKFVKRLKKHSIVLIDTNELLSASETTRNMMTFWDMLLSLRDNSEDVKLVTTDGVIKELIRHQKNPKKPELREPSLRALEKIQELERLGELFIVKDHTSEHSDKVKVHADRYFLNVVNNYKTVRNIYIITHDTNVMKDVHQTIEMDSISGHGAKSVYVCKLYVKKGQVDPSRLVYFEPNDGKDEKADSKNTESMKTKAPFKAKKSWKA